MEHFLLYIVGAFVVSLVCGFICIPVIIDICVKRKLYDTPDARKVHNGVVPRLGGISFLPSMLLAFLFGITLLINSYPNKHVELSLWSCYFFVSLTLIYCVGVADDLFGLGPKTKFVVQIIAASLLPLSYLYINNFYGLFGIYEIPYWVGAPLTVFIVVFINNAMNLIDGIDGLCGSLSLLALAGFLVCFVGEEMWYYSIFIAALMGVLSAFLYYNLFGKEEKRRKIFMGDTGSLTLGFILAFLLIKFSMDNPNFKPYRRNSLLLSYTLLIVPVFDVCRVVLVRMCHRMPLFKADKNHIHHKLLRAGLSQHKALIVIVGLALFYIGFNLLLDDYCYFSVILLIDILIWTVFNVIVNRLIIKRGRAPFELTK